MIKSHQTRWVRCSVVALTFGLLCGEGGDARGQTLHRTGQSVQPVFEGWNRNDDGSFTMWFGYMNRNYVEEPHVPAGTSNHFAPGPPDRGQPTHFYPRRQSFVFGVNVPGDWGDQDLVWTVSVHGKSYTATGSLWDTWVLDEGVWRVNRGGGLRGRYGTEKLTNKAPMVNVLGDAEVTARVGAPIALTATVSDDGLLGPQTRTERPPYDPLPNDLPTIGGRRSGAGSGVGGPTDQNIVNVRAAYETGLAVTWLHYRGPGRVTFSSMVTAVPLVDGRATTSAQFSEPGTYVIRAAADDGAYISTADVTVVVSAAP